MTTFAKLVTPEEQAVRFFKEVKNELGIDSTQKIVTVVRCVLSQLRKSLTHDQASQLIRKLPDTFQLLLISGWRYDEKEAAIKHLDELADQVYKETLAREKRLFSSEIDALNTVLRVIKKLDKFFGLLGLNLLRYTMTEEIKQAAAMEDAA
ncbi:MAG TPA: DUF2267 domain-containing protein [Cyclobacteriaceae bacterium]|nr:DUF2267 domain-containing protein [Cyclobacteriaceae bacterium]HMV10701.1 DUF2267 domain-containing protein [Cyclobacteriaceae bacterium]HMV91122.1 DUF2267 domain-containing protein [Cyclobacteriaceae bacterium]HMX00060.1 DUF2267 domain-containing protein [Cyclobacteriaceae bacterium]HMX49078.1 DUF2267 domain-containing protein [Cyclobacteriaceae bacterium]